MDLGDNWLMMGAGAAIFLATVSWLGDARRARRRNLDGVGFMPWTHVFFVAVLAAVLMLALGLKAWLGG